MNRMVVANLVHRPLRSLISIVAIAVEVTLILVIVGFSLGVLNDMRERQTGIGADIMVQPPGSSAFGTMSSAPVSMKVADVLRRLPHVTGATPVVTQLSTSGNVEVIYGIDIASFESLGVKFKYVAGGPFQGPNDIIVDDYFADSKKVHVGSNLDVLNHPFKVSGIVLHGRGARKFVPIQTMQEMIGAPGKASIFYVKLDSPDNVDTALQEIKTTPGMEQYVTRSMREWLSLMTATNIPGLSAFITVVIGVAVIIGFIVIFQAMYTAVMERTREIGILKSMGASKMYIVNVILRETMLLAAVGIILGIVLSFGAARGIIARFPTLRPEITLVWIGYATGIALVGALLGAVYPAFKAAQKDPIDALAYE